MKDPHPASMLLHEADNRPQVMTDTSGHERFRKSMELRDANGRAVKVTVKSRKK